jgi:DNA-binding MarR family transcriptional regulator
VKRTAAADALTELILEVFRVNGGLLAEGDRLTKPLGQTSARWQIFGALRNGPLPVATIAREMGRARQSVQRTADVLEGQGLVEYAPNPAHRRAKLVRLTPYGQEILSEVSRRQIAWTNRLARAIGSEVEIRQALEVVRKLRGELEGARHLTATRRQEKDGVDPSRDGKGGSKRARRHSDQSVRGAAGKRR